MYHWILKIILWENQRSWVISLWALLITDRDKSRILLFSSSLCMSSTVLYVSSLCECRRHCDIVPRCPFRNEGLIHVSARSTADSCPQVSVPSMYYVDWRKLPWSRKVLSRSSGWSTWGVKVGPTPNSANSEIRTPYRVNWGLHWDSSIVQLLPRSSSASFYTLSWVLIPSALPHKLSAC